MITHG